MQQEELIALLYKYHLKPDKRLGQHYLVDEKVLASIIETADIKQGEPILEIGAGPGILTKALAKAGGEVLAVEFDRAFCGLLQEEFHNWRNVRVLCEDALRLDFHSKKQGVRSEEQGRIVPRRIVANIPYQITNPLIRKILEPGSVIEAATLLIQKEVAERLMAKPGSSERGILTIMVEVYGTIEKVMDVSTSAFWPQPKVESMVVKITRSREQGVRSKENNSVFSTRPPIKDSAMADGGEIYKQGIDMRSLDGVYPEPVEWARDDIQKAFFWLVKQGFSGKRKMLINSLSGSLRLPKNEVAAIVKEAEVSDLARAEDLSIDDWVRLFHIYSKKENLKS